MKKIDKQFMKIYLNNQIYYGLSKEEIKHFKKLLAKEKLTNDRKG